MNDLQHVDTDLLKPIDTNKLFKSLAHPPKILLLYGSVRERSFSRLATEEAARLAYHSPTTATPATQRFKN